jgi:enterochelin esterase family protein
MASKRLIIGDSYGANISAVISHNYPEIFGNCGLQSGAFDPNNSEALRLLTSGETKNIKYSSLWGSYEWVYINMRQLRDYLKVQGYQIDWGEYPEGHSWGLWRANLDKMLIYIFPSPSVGVKNELHGNASLPDKCSLSQNYPNPFNPSTVIRYQLPQTAHVTLKVYDTLGREVATLVNERQQAGFYTSTFNIDHLSLASGVYLYCLQSGLFVQTKKLILMK